MQGKTRKNRIWIIAGVIIVLIAAFLFISNRIRSRMAQIVYNAHTVALGSVEASITGSGKLTAADTQTIDLPSGIRVEDVFVKPGDRIDAKEALAVLDTDSLQKKAASLSDELAALDRQLLLMSSRTAQEVYAPVKGRIKYLPVAAGDDVVSGIAKYGALAILSTDSLMRVEIETDAPLEPHAKVTVKWGDHEAQEGEIAAKTKNGYRITLDDDGTPYGEAASVYQGDTLLGSGVIGINKPVAVHAGGGTIEKVHYKENASVNANAKLFTLNNAPLSSAYQQAYAEREDLAKLLQKTIAYIHSPVIVAENKGTVGEVRIAKGETIGGSAAPSANAASLPSSAGDESTAFVIHADGALTMTISVDELDIGSVVPGQSAEVTLDAMSSETFTATVKRISYIGNAQGSITTYAVELLLANDERFLEGMNGNATIMVDRADNVLLIPIEAINEDETGVYVYVSASGSPDGADRKRMDIATGLSDGEYAQVTSGLSEGDVVLYAASSSTDYMFPGMQGSMGMPNGMSRFSAGGERDGD